MYYVTDHEELDYDVINAQALYVVTVQYGNTVNSLPNLIAAMDYYFRKVGVMNHPDIGIAWTRSSVRSDQHYVLLNNIHRSI